MRKLTCLAVVMVFTASSLLLPFVTPMKAHAVTSPGYNGKLLINSNKDGNYEIYTTEADGSNEVRLTNNGSYDWAFGWSPNGTKIAFVSNRDGGNQEIYVMNADGSNQTRLTNNGIVDIYAQWSPDGSKILYAAPQFGASVELYTMNADGTGTIQLTTNGAQDSNARWSPDGSRIVFDRGSEIYVIDADGSNETRLTNNAVANFGGLWSPDGESLLYTQCNAGFTQCDVWQMDTNGGNQVKLFNAPTPDYPYIDVSLSRYSPDGKKLIADAWVSDWTVESSFLVNMESMALTQLIDTPADVYVSD